MLHMNTNWCTRLIFLQLVAALICLDAFNLYISNHVTLSPQTKLVSRCDSRGNTAMFQPFEPLKGSFTDFKDKIYDFKDSVDNSRETNAQKREKTVRKRKIVKKREPTLSIMNIAQDLKNIIYTASDSVFEPINSGLKQEEDGKDSVSSEQLAKLKLAREIRRGKIFELKEIAWSTIDNVDQLGRSASKIPQNIQNIKNEIVSLPTKIENSVENIVQNAIDGLEYVQNAPSRFEKSVNGFITSVSNTADSISSFPKNLRASVSAVGTNISILNFFFVKKDSNDTVAEHNTVKLVDEQAPSQLNSPHVISIIKNKLASDESRSQTTYSRSWFQGTGSKMQIIISSFSQMFAKLPQSEPKTIGQRIEELRSGIQYSSSVIESLKETPKKFQTAALMPIYRYRQKSSIIETAVKNSKRSNVILSSTNQSALSIFLQFVLKPIFLYNESQKKIEQAKKVNSSNQPAQSDEPFKKLKTADVIGTNQYLSSLNLRD